MNPAAGETDEAYRHFSETLEAELVANVKPVIMSLTMLAEDYSAHSAYIARAIEEYILKVIFCYTSSTLNLSLAKLDQIKVSYLYTIR